MVMKAIKAGSIVGSVTAVVERSLSLFAATALVIVASAAICEAQTNNLTVNSLSFPTGQVLTEGIENVVVPEGGCGVATVTAVPSFVNSEGVKYDFVFWNIDATPYTTTEVNFETLCSSPSTATAWFLATGPGSGPPQVDTWAFSLNHNAVIANTSPIQSVANGTWSGGSSTVVYTTGTAPVTITAIPKISGYGRFTAWEEIALPPSPLATGSAFTVAADSSAWAIGFYGIPVPDPCETLRLELQSCLADLSGKACLPIGKALSTCESYYGEN
jgi:hypothetical protein